MNASLPSTTRLFSRTDWSCGGLAACIAFAVYFWTTAPNVTLLDSGEFIVAAQHFGVPHPTGYPLWTFLAWLFHLLPLGNAAWEINLFSGVCGAAATGLTAMFIRSTGLWMTDDQNQNPPWATSLVAVAVALAFAFSFSMWSQAVIAEVYTLHALLVGLFFISLYAWVKNPDAEAPIFWAFFTLTLAFSNHHLSLVLAPLPFLVAMLIRRDLLPDLVMASLVSALIGYLGFALVADNPLVFKAALRFTWLIGPVFLIFLWVRGKRTHFRLLVFLPFVIALGMLPYAYLPIASSTNPPMNWGYTRTVEGFFASFNRSQYQGSLSDQSLRALGSVVGMGTDGPAVVRPESDLPSPDRGYGRAALRWAQFFWEKLIISFSPVSIILFFGVALLALRRPLERRVWYYVLLVGFTLAAFLQPIMDRARIDDAGWWVQMPYHTYTNFLFAMICGTGGIMLTSALSGRGAKWRPVAAAMIALMPLWGLIFNAEGASQRNRWFGWKYGHDMLSPLPAGAVIFGGTDPGRFVPTYMIFGESSQPASSKLDPAFDRRDLYIITQNATADPLYISYLRDHYTNRRPKPRNAFERWLGREEMYPSEPLKIPTRGQVTELLTAKAEEVGLATEGISERNDITQLTHGEIAKWIFENNKSKHRFFVEESYPMEWSYDHAIPSGLLYEISPEPLAELTTAMIDSDMLFWRDYVPSLTNDPLFMTDYDARRSFSKLRLTSARLYKYRGLRMEAKQAAEESIILWPGNLEAIQTLSFLLWEEGDYATPLALFETAFMADPHNPEAAELYILARDRHDAAPAIAEALRRYRKTPSSIEEFEKLIHLLAAVGDKNQVETVREEAQQYLGENDQFLSLMADLHIQFGELAEARDLAVKRATMAASADLWLDVAAIESERDDVEAAKSALNKATALDRERTTERLTTDPFLKHLRTPTESDLTQPDQNQPPSD